MLAFKIDISCLILMANCRLFFSCLKKKSFLFNRFYTQKMVPKLYT